MGKNPYRPRQSSGRYSKNTSLGNLRRKSGDIRYGRGLAQCWLRAESPCSTSCVNPTTAHWEVSPSLGITLVCFSIISMLDDEHSRIEGYLGP
jgi:hypothetical protein